MLNHAYKIYIPHICHSLARSGSSEHHKFCECFDIVVADESITPRQLDPLNILEPWRKVCAIDEDELVMLIILCSCLSLLKILSSHPPCVSIQEDETGTLRGVLVKDVITAWNTYMSWLYLLGGIRCPTKVYFSLSTLAGDSRYHFKHRCHGQTSSGFLYEHCCNFLLQSIEKEIQCSGF